MMKTLLRLSVIGMIMFSACLTSKQTWLDLSIQTDLSTIEISELIEDYQTNNQFPSHFPIQQIRLNFHIMDTVWLCPQNEGKTIQQSFQFYINQVIFAANKLLANNQPANLPLNNTYEVLPIQLVLTLDTEIGEESIYYYYDNPLAFNIDTNGRSLVNNRYVYAKQKNDKEVVNVFLIANKPLLTDPKAKPKIQGYTWKNKIKLINYNTNDYDIDQAARVLVHELGHVLGLSHTWKKDDGCDDTPTHKNCWNFGAGRNCDSLVSNNVMDYNRFCNSWTACQIGQVKRNLNTLDNSIRRYLTFKPKVKAVELIIENEVVWKGGRDFYNSDIRVSKKGHLIIDGRLGLMNKHTILLEKGAKMTIGKNAFIHKENKIPISFIKGKSTQAIVYE